MGDAILARLQPATHSLWGGLMYSISQTDLCFIDVCRAFRGVARFKKNVTNFSGLLEGVDLKIRKFEEQPEYVRAHWVFSSSIKLPWKPRIAAGGYTTHVFNKVTLEV